MALKPPTLNLGTPSSTIIGTLNTPASTVWNGGVVGSAGGMPVYGSTSGTSTSPSLPMLCATAHTRFPAGEEQQSARHTLMFSFGSGPFYVETTVRAIYWDVGVLPQLNPIRDLVRAFETDEEDDIHTDPMALFAAGVWAPRTATGFVSPSIPLSFGLPAGPLPKASWCRGGSVLARPLVVPLHSTLGIEIAFTRKWAPSRDVDLTFTLEMG